MEIFVTTLTVLLSLFSGGGLFVNNYLANFIRQQFQGVEQVNVRVDSIPTHKLLRGEADSLQVSIKQWQPIPDVTEGKTPFTIALFELETEEINLDVAQIRKIKNINFDNWQSILNKPLNLGWRIIITEDSLNALINSSQVQSILKNLGENSPSSWEISAVSVDLTEKGGVVIDSQVKLAFRGEELLNIRLEFTPELLKGHKLKINALQGSLNNRQLSSQLLQGFADNISDQLTLRFLEQYAITARLLKFDIDSQQLEIAGFIHLNPN